MRGDSHCMLSTQTLTYILMNVSSDKFSDKISKLSLRVSLYKAPLNVKKKQRILHLLFA